MTKKTRIFVIPAAASDATAKAFTAPALSEPLLGCDCPSHDEGGGAKFGAGGKGGGKVENKNFAPSPVDDAFVTDEATTVTLDVLLNDSDRNGDLLTITHIAGKAISVGATVTLTSGARVTLNADMTLRYDPADAWSVLDHGQSGQEDFSYTVSDGRGGVRSATVAVTVQGVGNTVSTPDPVQTPEANLVPTATGDYASTTEKSVVSGNVLSNDSDPDGDPLTVMSVNGNATAVGQTITLASGARLTLRVDGSYSYDPNGKFNALNDGQKATDSFTYAVSDGRGGVSSAKATVSIAGVSDAVAVPTPYYVQDLLLSSSQRWNAGSDYGTAATVTFAFLSATPGYYASSDWANSQFRAFTTAQEAATLKALADISSYANITFVETADVSKAAITFGIADIPSYAGYAYYPSGTGVNSRAGDVWIDSGYAGDSFVGGTFMYTALIHEIGHAIGLDHVGSLSGIEDTRQYTVMSYNKHSTMNVETSTHMPYDIATVQHIYGANMGARTGDDTYRLADLNNKTRTIWDAGGVDTIDFSAATKAVTIDLRPGSFSTAADSGRNNIAIAFGATIENARGGAGADVIVSNAADNVMTGGAGADMFRFFADWGRDAITDFQRGLDLIDLSPTGLGFADLAISVTGGSIVIGDGDDAIALLGLSAVDQSDFVFGLA